MNIYNSSSPLNNNYQDFKYESNNHTDNNLIHLQSYQQTQQFDDLKLSTARFEEMPLQYESTLVIPLQQQIQQNDHSLSNSQHNPQLSQYQQNIPQINSIQQNSKNPNLVKDNLQHLKPYIIQSEQNKDSFYQQMIENLQFELKVEQLKVEKMRKEWTQKKDLYTNQIQQLSQQNSQKSAVLNKLESELKDMRQKVQFFYENYQNKDKEAQEIQKQLKEIQSDKYKAEIELAREKEKAGNKLSNIQDLEQQNKQLKDQLIELSEYSQKLDKDKIKIKQERQVEFDRAYEFLIIVTNQHQINKKGKKLSFMELFQKAIESVFVINEKRLHSDLDLLEQRLKLTQQNMRKMKMEFQKINAERLFYKGMYKKRIVNDTLQDNTNHIVNTNTSFLIEKQNPQINKSSRQNSTQKPALFQEVLKKQSKEVNEILGLVEDNRMQQQPSMNTLQISPIKMFNLDKEISKGLSKLDVDHYDISESENSNTYEIDTFRSNDVEQALQKAQHLMKFKHDKEFINKVLDAQIRVNQIETNILKNATTLSQLKRSASKSSNKKPTKDKTKTKYDSSAMNTSIKALRN